MHFKIRKCFGETVAGKFKYKVTHICFVSFYYVFVLQVILFIQVKSYDNPVAYVYIFVTIHLLHRVSHSRIVNAFMHSLKDW